MYEIWGALMLVSGGLFAGGSATFAWSRVPIWRRLPVDEFARDFEQTIHRTDTIQPALLLLAVASGAGFVITADGASRVIGALGVAGLILVLLASLAIMVPLQRQIIVDAQAGGAGADIEEMRRRWYTGNLGRSLLSVMSYLLLAVAAVG